MATFFLTMLVLGVVVLALQLLLGLFGLDGEGLFEEGGGDGADGLDLFTVRALSAAASAFGLVGLGLMRMGLPGWIGIPVALLAALGAAYAIAATMRGMRRFEQDRSFVIETAIGLPATVALGIPGQHAGAGKIHVVAHERFQELTAVTGEDAIPSGTSVYIVDVQSSDTVVVARSLSLLEDSDAAR
jgi:hypothetical protein